MIHEATWPFRRLSEDLIACIDCYIAKHDRTVVETEKIIT